MSVIFQLFCAEDLFRFNEDERKILRARIKEALENAKAAEGITIVTTTSAGPTALSLRLSADTEPQSVVTEQQIREQLRAALTKRFHEVLHQLKSPQLKPSQQSEQSREIFPFETLKNENKTLSKGEEEILQWAITCEVNNFDFYYPLLLAKTAAYEYFKEVTKGLTPKGPDSPYSPFNPRHPLYNLFYNFTKPKSNSTQDTAAPSC